MKKTAVLLGIFIGVAGAAQAEVIISDDFSSDTISTDLRLRVQHTANNWIETSKTASDWTVAGGMLTNAATTTDGISEGGLLRVFDVGAASLSDHTQLTFSFDYTVGAGSTLYFHAIGLNNGILTGATQLHNVGVAGGSIQSQYDSSGDYTGYNIKNGALSPSGAVSGALVALSDSSGTFTQTYDISAYGGLDDINDLQYITMGWSAIVTTTGETGAMSVDNFKVEAIPEPAVLSLVVIFGGGILVLKRRFS